MTVDELREMLEDFEGHEEVRLAMAPAWSMEYSIDSVIDIEENGNVVVYIGEGEQLGYLNSEAKAELGW